MLPMNILNESKKTDSRWFADTERLFDEIARQRKHYDTAVLTPKGATKMINLATPLDRENVLEIGGGIKPIGTAIKPRHLTLMDISAGQLDFAREQLEFSRKWGAERGNPNLVPKEEQISFIHANARQQIPQALAGQKFSLTIMAELLTHVPPAEREQVLTEWSKNTGSFMIVDRHNAKPEILSKYPEFVNGEIIKKILEKLGFTIKHFSTEQLEVMTHKGKGTNTYFFLTAKKE